MVEENLNSVIINNKYIIIDCFFSNKYNSIVVIMNNRDLIKNNNIDINNIKYFLNNEEILLINPEIKDYVHLDGKNRKYTEFNKNFHIEVLYKPNVNILKENNKFKIIIGEDIYNFNLHPISNDHIENKCISTMFKDEYHLLDKWIDYHKKIGFEKFILYDNNSNNIPVKYLSKIENILIIKAKWKYYDNDSHNNCNSIGQNIQQNHCIWKYCPKFLALTDLDEYINPHNFNIFDNKKSVLSIPNYFFNANDINNFTIEDSFYREDDKYDSKNRPERRKCIINSNNVDLFCVHIPINFKDIYYADCNEVQLNHYKNLSNAKRKIENYNKFDDSIILNINNNMFDIVIPVGPNDKEIITKQIEFTKKNIIGYRNIYLICYDPSINIDGCITIDENIFPFTIDTIIKFHGKLERNGWYLQQLLKLYAGIIIPYILEKYLVIDSDTFFLKPTTFIKDNKCLYNYGNENHNQYFEHMKKLNKDLIKVDKNKSGICHHMIFETKYLKELFNIIEKEHNDIFYNIFLKLVTDYKGSGASEYEIYFNYMLKNYNDNIIIRSLNWCNTNTLDINTNKDYISWHWYMRK